LCGTSRIAAATVVGKEVAIMSKKREASPALMALRDRVEAWRTEQGKRSVIPDELWDAAVEVAKGPDGVWLTQQLTRFQYDKLKTKVAEGPRARRGALAIHEKIASVTANRVATRPNGRGRAGVVQANGPTPAGAGFIELSASTLGASGRTVIEFVGRHGDRMRVEAAGGVDLVGLARTFWRGGEL
jgi:hypothetical protein